MPCNTKWFIQTLRKNTQLYGYVDNVLVLCKGYICFPLKNLSYILHLALAKQFKDLRF